MSQYVVATTKGISRTMQRDSKLQWEFDNYAHKFNAVLKDDPLVQHLLPIKLAADDLLEKLRDGLLLSAFINRLPGCANLIDVKKLHRATGAASAKLNMFQVAHNQDVMIQAAKFIGINTESIGVLDLIEAKKNKHLVLRLLQEIMQFESMQKLMYSMEKLDESFMETDARFNTLKAINKTTRTSSVDQKPRISNSTNHLLLKNFLNDMLAHAGAKERISDSDDITEVLSDCKIYTIVLNDIAPEAVSKDILSKDEPLERAADLLSAMEGLGIKTYLQNTDMVYGDTYAHHQIISSIAEYVSRISAKANKSESAPASTKSDLLEVPGLSIKTESGLPTKTESGFPTKTETAESTDKKDSEASLTADDEEQLMVRKDSTPESTGTSPLDATAGSRTTAFDKSSNYVTQNTIKPSPPMTRSYKVPFIFLLFGILLICIGFSAPAFVNARISRFLDRELPLNDQNYGFLNNTELVHKFFFWNYENTAELSTNPNAKISVEQVGPFEVREKINIYNITFQEVNSRKVMKYMQRSSFVVTDPTLKTRFINTPSAYYVSGIANNYVNSYILRLGRDMSSLKTYFESVLANHLKQLCIPIFVRYALSEVPVSSLSSSWSSGDSVTLEGGIVFPGLPSPIPVSAASGVLDSSFKYSISLIGVSSDNGISPWYGSLTPISSQLFEDSFASSQSLASSYVDSIKSWMVSLDSKNYLDAVVKHLLKEGVITVEESNTISTWADLALYQLGTGKIVQFLSSGTEKSVFGSASGLFGFDLFPGIPEFGSFVSTFSTEAFTLSNTQVNGMFSTFSNPLSAVMFLFEVSSNQDASLQFSAAGVTKANQNLYAAYLKHILKMSYIKESNLGVERQIPPPTGYRPGLFIRKSVFNLLFGFNDPNLNLELAESSSFTLPLLKSHISSDSHWNENRGLYSQQVTGEMVIEDTRKLKASSGLSSVLGRWKSDEVIDGANDYTSTQPKNKDPQESTTVWDSSLSRRLLLQKTDVVSNFKGVDVFRYHVDNSHWQNLNKNPNNDKFMMYGPDGLMNMEPEFNGGPIWISKPHYMDSDPSVTSFFSEESFSADANSHETYVDYEPNTGLAFRYAKRLQVNLKLSHIDFLSEPGYQSLFSNKETIYAPYYWQETTEEISDERATLFKEKIFDLRESARMFMLIVGLLGIVLFLVGLYKLASAKKANSSYQGIVGDKIDM